MGIPTPFVGYFSSLTIFCECGLVKIMKTVDSKQTELNINFATLPKDIRRNFRNALSVQAKQSEFTWKTTSEKIFTFDYYTHS